MENEIIEVPEIVEADEVIAATEGAEDTGKGFLIPLIVGGVALVSFIVYKKIIKPIAAKIKAKKEQASEEQITIDNQEPEYEVEPEDEASEE